MNNFIKKIEICDKVALFQTQWISSKISDDHTLVDFKDYQTSSLYFENVPTSNICLNIRRWTITDNRGFVVKLTKNNILFLLKHCAIKNGRIMEPCVYNKIRKNTYSLIPARFV